jgi:trimeric autotransporter adhesin
MQKFNKYSFTLAVLLFLNGLSPSFSQNAVLTTSTAFPGVGTGFSNVLIGANNTFPGANNANYNVFIGQFSGNAITTGDNNSFLGYLTGYNNTTGSNNSFIGFQTGQSNSTGNFNSFLGSQAGIYNSTGGHNAFIGYQAGFDNTQGSYNSFMGSFTGNNNTSGNNNTFLGYYSGYTNTTGNHNSFVGSSAGYFNSTGENNSYVGYHAGRTNTTGNYNSFFGAYAGYGNTVGNHNSYLGYETGYTNTTGSKNAFIGYQAGYRNSTGNYNAFMGYGAGYSNTIGESNSFLGDGAGYFNLIGSFNTFLGKFAGFNNTAGTNNTFVGSAADGTGPSLGNLQRATAVGYHALVAVNDGLVLGDTVGVKVGIGTAYPDEKLTVRGNMNFLAYDNSLMLKNQPFLHFNEHESLAFGLGAELPADAEKTLVIGSEEATIKIPGILKNYRPNAGQFLTVDERGNMLLTESRVQVASIADWSDKVFEAGYALRPLGEVEEFVKKYKHLPGIPSAAAMVAEGVDVTTIITKQMEKIEELTLYVITLEKTNSEITTLREEVAELKRLLK